MAAGGRPRGRAADGRQTTEAEDVSAEPAPTETSAAELDAMRLALDEARLASTHGDVPIGAVGLVGGEVVGSRHNERELQRDPTAHAEILLLRDIASRRAGWRMNDLTVVVTLEPCPMCAGALVAARVGRLVFGAADLKAGAVGSLYNLCADPRLNHELSVRAGVLAEECGSLLTRFFTDLRGAPPG